MYAGRIIHLNPLIAIEILSLADSIPQLQSLELYWKYLQDTIEDKDTALFGLWCDRGVLHTFIHAEGPHPVIPDTGYIFAAASKPGTSVEENRRLLSLVEKWFSEHGCIRWEMITSRSPLAWERQYGATQMPEYVLGKQI